MSSEATSPRTPPTRRAVQARVDHALVSARSRIRSHAGDAAAVVDRYGTVQVEFSGACRGCPVKAFTYELVVRPAIARVPGVADVSCSQVRTSEPALRRLRSLVKAYGAQEDA